MKSLVLSEISEEEIDIGYSQARGQHTHIYPEEWGQTLVRWSSVKATLILVCQLGTTQQSDSFCYTLYIKAYIFYMCFGLEGAKGAGYGHSRPCENSPYRHFKLWMSTLSPWFQLEGWVCRWILRSSCQSVVRNLNFFLSLCKALSPDTSRSFLANT